MVRNNKQAQSDRAKNGRDHEADVKGRVVRRLEAESLDDLYEVVVQAKVNYKLPGSAQDMVYRADVAVRSRVDRTVVAIFGCKTSLRERWKQDLPFIMVWKPQQLALGKPATFVTVMKIENDRWSMEKTIRDLANKKAAAGSVIDCFCATSVSDTVNEAIDLVIKSLRGPCGGGVSFKFEKRDGYTLMETVRDTKRDLFDDV